MKTLKITEETHKDLMIFKAKWQAKTFDELLQTLMDYYELTTNDKVRK